MRSSEWRVRNSTFKKRKLFISYSAIRIPCLPAGRRVPHSHYPCGVEGSVPSLGGSDFGASRGVSLGGTFSGFFLTTSLGTSAFVSAFTAITGRGSRPFARSFFLFSLLFLLRASSRSLSRLGILSSLLPLPPLPRACLPVGRGRGKVRGSIPQFMLNIAAFDRVG